MADMEIKFCDPVVFNALLQLRRDRKISWRAVGLGMVIANFANQDGDAWPSRAMLSAITGIDRADISNTARELRDAGFLTIDERAGHSTVYRLTRRRFATGGDLPPVGVSPPTRRRNAPKPVGVSPPITIKEQLSNNMSAEPLFSSHGGEGEGGKNTSEPPSGQPGDKSTPPKLELKPPPAMSKGKTKTSGKGKVKSEREQIAERIVHLYRQKVRSAQLDKATPLGESVKRISVILDGEATEADLVRAVNNAAVYFAKKDEDHRVGIRRFFSKNQGDVWREFLTDDSRGAFTGAASGTASPLQDDDSLGYLGYKLERVEAKYGEDVARQYDAKAREFRSTIRADEWLEREVACPTA